MNMRGRKYFWQVNFQLRESQIYEGNVEYLTMASDGAYYWVIAVITEMKAVTELHHCFYI